MASTSVFREIGPLEGEDDEEPVDVSADRLHPPFAPRPDLRGDVIEGADAVLFGPAGHLHVESRIVHQNQHVGGELRHVGLTLPHLPPDGPEVLQHLHDAEERGLPVVFAQILRAARRGHAVPAPEAEFRPGIGFLQPSDQVCAVQVARRLPGDEVVFHLFDFIGRLLPCLVLRKREIHWYVPSASAFVMSKSAPLKSKSAGA